ncbi:MAG: N-acetyl-gamma-glutamyl-phosphate reductase [Chloroflexota bacterium]
MINVGLYGATGYTGYETLKILRKHPDVKLNFATSESYAGKPYSEVYPVPWDMELVPSAEANLQAVDAVFCCLPHAASMPTVIKAREAGVRVIDLSADFRLKNVDIYEKWYDTDHEAPDLLADSAYGLPELNRQEIQETDLLANPGCYPTSIILALYPLFTAKYLNPNVPIISDSKSGVSGAGRKLSLKTHFVEVSDNLSPYNIGQKHRHTAEVEQAIDQYHGADLSFIFSPHLVPISRGMLSTIYVSLNQDVAEAEIRDLFEAQYHRNPFMRILPAGELATFAHTQNRNDCAISITWVNERNLIICSSIDNLGKGAAGQAVQNFNLMFGLDETEALM